MITAIVGAFFGSEGKGAIVGHIAGSYSIHVRVGAANAGHTVYAFGEKHVVQQLPCAAYANPDAQLVLGPGAMISPGILQAEIERNRAWRHRHDLPVLQLYVDHRAHCITDDHIVAEQQTDLAQRIGSTSMVAREGIGSAQAARVMRTNYKLAVDDWRDYPIGTIVWCDTVALLHDAKVFAASILLEGTQGTGLDNVLGIYPYVTSRHVTASGLAADCGLGPRDIEHVIAVARSYPIRVAGNSGPFWPGSDEIGWKDLGVDEEKERTTVTKKVRRVATFSMNQMRWAARVNSATEIALTFADYLAPELAGKSGAISAEELASYDKVGPLVRHIEEETFVPVTYVGTGPDTVLDREPPARFRD